MSLIVKTIAKIASGLIFAFGIYIITHGHLTPGGGFAGGVIIACSFILPLLAYGKEEKLLEQAKAHASLTEALGIIAFWVIAFLGLIIGGIYFLNFLPKGEQFKLFSAGSIPLSNIAIGIEVGGALLSILFALVLLYLIEEREE